MIKNSLHDPYYGDRLNREELTFYCSQLFPDFCTDIALTIIQHLDLTELGVCGRVSKSWNLITNHIFAEKRAELYKQIFSPDDWNHFFKNMCIPYDEMKKAFKCLSPSIDLTFYAIAWMPKNLTLNKFGIHLKDHYTSGYTAYSSDKILKQYGNIPIRESFWIVLRNVMVPNSTKKKYSSQKLMVERLQISRKKAFAMPKLLEVVVVLACEDIKFKRKLFDDLFVRTVETIDSGKEIYEVAATIDEIGVTIHSCPMTGPQEAIAVTAIRTLFRKEVKILNF